MTETTPTTAAEGQVAARKPNKAGRLVFLLITLGCFVYLYFRLNGAAARGIITG